MNNQTLKSQEGDVVRMRRTVTSTLILLALSLLAPGALAKHLVDGMMVDAEYVPYQGIMVTQIDQQPLTCGVILLSLQWVMVSAHCLKQPVTSDLEPSTPINVYLGISQLHEVSSAVTRKVTATSIIMIHDPHPGASSRQNFYSDIALLKLETAITITAKVKPINLPTRDYQFDQRAIISGYGLMQTSSRGLFLSARIRYTEVKIQNKDACVMAFRDYFQQKYPNVNQHISSRFLLCARQENESLEGCYGDSSWALAVCETNLQTEDGKKPLCPENNWQIVGLALPGYGCTSMSTPGIFANILGHSALIQTIISK